MLVDPDNPDEMVVGEGGLSGDPDWLQPAANPPNTPMGRFHFYWPASSIETESVDSKICQV